MSDYGEGDGAELPADHAPVSVFKRVPLDSRDVTEGYGLALDTLDPDKMRPLRDMIFVRREQPDAMVGTLHAPEQHRDMKLTARVVAVGPGRYLKKSGRVRQLDVKVGDRVVLSKVIRVKGKFQHPDGLIETVDESEVLAVIEE